MSILNQKTLKKSVSFSGIGLHTGEKVNLKICPSTPNSGIQFKRIDLKSNNVVILSFLIFTCNQGMCVCDYFSEF